MIDSLVPGQTNVTGRMMHNRVEGNPEHTEPFTAALAIILCSMCIGLNWLIAFLIFIGVINPIDGSVIDSVTLILLSIISGLLSFISLCLIMASARIIDL